MPRFKQEPAATCNIISKDPSELDPWSIHLVSLMQTIQSNGPANFYPGRISWITVDKTPLAFNISEGEQGHPRAVGFIDKSDTMQGLNADDDLYLVFLMTGDILLATLNDVPVVTGRHGNPSEGYHGYITWTRIGTPNQPRLEVSPNQVITLWRHWPESDEAPSQPEFK